MDFLSLRSIEGTSVADYQVRFLMLERFARGSFSSEREQIAQLVSSLISKWLWLHFHVPS